MNHVCGWPNPIRAGLFGAGLFNTVLAYFWKVYPLVSIEYPLVGTASVFLVPVIVFLYVSLLWKDPGKLVCKGD